MPLNSQIHRKFLITSMLRDFNAVRHDFCRQPAMPTPAKITLSLRRLSALETGSGPLAAALTATEQKLEIARLRAILPASILGHHDRMIQRGKPSIAPVADGICTACHLRLPTGHLARLQSSQDLEVCDHCGTFLYLSTPQTVQTGQ
jgi:hypothetical protein